MYLRTANQSQLGWGQVVTTVTKGVRDKMTVMLGLSSLSRGCKFRSENSKQTSYKTNMFISKSTGSWATFSDLVADH